VVEKLSVRTLKAAQWTSLRWNRRLWNDRILPRNCKSWWYHHSHWSLKLHFWWLHCFCWSRRLLWGNRGEHCHHFRLCCHTLHDFTTDVTVDIDDHNDDICVGLGVLVNSGSTKRHSTPNPAQISSLCPSTGRIRNQIPDVDWAKRSSNRLKHSLVPRPLSWIPAASTPRHLWRFRSWNGSSWLACLPCNDRRVVTIVKTTICCRSCWYVFCHRLASNRMRRAGSTCVTTRRQNSHFSRIVPELYIQELLRWSWYLRYDLTRKVHLFRYKSEQCHQSPTSLI
jgi:hypothetical protein